MVGYFILALCASHVAATKVMFVKGTTYGNPAQSNELLEVDLQGKTSRHILDLNGAWDLRSSVVCGNTWYGAGSRWPPYPGRSIQMVDISGSAGKFIGIQSTNFFPYQIRCGQKEHELFVIGNDDTGFQDKLRLYHVSNLDSDPTFAIIGTFPIDYMQSPGESCIFQYTEDSLYAHCGIQINATAFSAEMFKMELTSGTISVHKQYEGAPGRPIFFVRPSGGKFNGVLARPKSQPYVPGPMQPPITYDYYFCNIDASGTKVRVSQCKEYARAQQERYGWLNAIAGSPAHCAGDDTNYYFTSFGVHNGSDRSGADITGADMNTGALTDAFHLKCDDGHSSCAPWFAATVCCTASMTPKPTPKPHSCPGGSLKACIEECPANVYDACAKVCGDRCPTTMVV